MIHIEGMGWLGAVTAFRLHTAGIPFTWHDLGTAATAWQACLGMVYPAGDNHSKVNMHRWACLHRDTALPPGTITETAFAYTTPGPPHDGGYHPLLDLKWIRIANTAAYAVNVQAIVLAARRQFAVHRTPAPHPGQPVIVAHGDTGRRHGWSWGWSMPLRLLLPEPLRAVLPDRPVALHSRPHRFMTAVVVPIPGRPDWYRVGSASMPQRRPRELALNRHIETWRRQASDQFPGLRVLEAGPPVHGWRPRPATDDTPVPIESTRDDGAPQLVYPPLGDLGVRWAPTLTDQALSWALAHTHTRV